MSQFKYFTSESVTEGHPDKLCDHISDYVLDACLALDNNARVACEAFTTRGLIVVGGEISYDLRKSGVPEILATKLGVDLKEVARKAARDIGYIKDELGLNANTCNIQDMVGRQSPDISGGVDKRTSAHEGDDIYDKLGAGDQGLMFGFACRETDKFDPSVLMPLPIYLAHQLALQLTKVRKESSLKWIRPDGKTQVTVEYNDKGAVGIRRVLVSTQHDPVIQGVDCYKDHKQANKIIRDALIERVIIPIIGRENFTTRDWDDAIITNPSGAFVIGGPQGDTGLTGRKIIVDTYGGYARHGGGAFSGKDPTKVDRSAAYYARYAAKNLVAADLCERAEVQVAYAIGNANPMSVSVNTFGTNKIDEDKINKILNTRDIFDFRPAAMIHHLKLTDPSVITYSHYSAYGHFGRTDLNCTWEKTDKVHIIRETLGLPVN